MSEREEELDGRTMRFIKEAGLGPLFAGWQGETHLTRREFDDLITDEFDPERHPGHRRLKEYVEREIGDREAALDGLQDAEAYAEAQGEEELARDIARLYQRVGAIIVGDDE